MCCTLQMWAEGGIWTNEYNKNECANSFELTPDKPYAEFWLGFIGSTSGKFAYTFDIKYVNQDVPDLQEVYRLDTVNCDKNYQYTANHSLKCGTVFAMNLKKDASADGMRVRMYFSKIPKTGTLQMAVTYHVITSSTHTTATTSFDIKDGSTVMVVDPILDTQADPISGTGKVGQQKLYITSTADISSYRWTDSGSSKTYANTGDTKSVLVINLPPTETTQKRDIELYYTYTNSSSWDWSSRVWTFSTTTTVEYQPFHSVKSVSPIDMTNYALLQKGDDPFLTEEEFNSGVRRYLSFVSHKNSGYKASYDAGKDIVVSKQTDDTSTLFTVVRCEDDYNLVRIYPYGVDRPLGARIGGSGNLYVGLDTQNYDLWQIRDFFGTYGRAISSAALSSKSWYFNEDGTLSLKEYEIDEHFRADVNNYGDYKVSGQQCRYDEDWLRHPQNVVRWYVEHYDDGDVMDGDAFLVQRATKSDFSDATTVGSFSLDEYKEKLTIAGVVTAAYEFADDDEASLYNPIERSLYAQNGTLPKMYYRVVRAVVYGLWPNNMGSYATTSDIELHSLTPSITSFTATRGSDWDNDKRAVLTLKFNNPRNTAGSLVRKYVWDEHADVVITRRGYDDVDRTTIDRACTQTITIKGTDVVWNDADGCYTATVEDALTYPYTYYYYEARVDATGAMYPTEELKTFATTSAEATNLYNKTAALVSNLQATQGEEDGRVVVTWEADDGLLDGFELVRQAFLGSSNSSSESNFGAEKVLLTDTKTMVYVDDDVAPDSAYRYTVRAKMTYRGMEYQNTKVVMGWASGLGSLRGQVRLANGAAMPGRLTVTAKRMEALDRTEVMIDGKVCIPSLHIDKGTEVSTVCDADGCFSLEGLAYNGADTPFELTVAAEDGTLSFENSQGVAGPYAATLSRAKTEYSGITFTCRDEYRITGRVLYESSTVPVRDVTFKVYYGTDETGYTLKDASGQDIVTNQTGNFDFYVPKANIRIQAYKEGHTMKGEGYIKNQNNEVQFVPSRDLAGLQIADQTKVRLIGRLCGGDIEGDKPVGFGLSKNNLGDNLTMVLQLEGDNTSQIVYHDDNPDNTTDNYTIALGTDTTTYTFEKKRIVIHPSTATGEFAVDLFPAKYKITQLSAKGYSTLYADGEGFQVMDLSADSVMKEKRLEVRGEAREVSYNAIYKKVYHAPVSVTYQQSLFGGVYDVNYIGEQKMKLLDLSGQKVTYEIAHYDKETDHTTYTFLHPVFQEGNDYTLRVNAHEDYYYNGTDKTRLDQVALRGGQLVIANGMEQSESGEQPLKALDLDTLGRATFTFTAGNPTFLLTGDEAIKGIKMQVNLNGLYYDAAVLKGYVVGTRTLSDEALLTLDDKIDIVDVLRDPPGSNSYAYREAGTTYTWQYDHSELAETALDISLTTGPSFDWRAGFGYMPKTQIQILASGNIHIPLTYRSLTKTTAEYTMTLEDRVSTSSDPYDVGAMADVYIGKQDMYTINEVESFSILDESDYNMLREGILSGAIKEIATGKTDDDKPYWLVTGKKWSIGKSVKSTFQYTQKHILGVLIPELEDKIRQCLLTCTEAEAKALADQSGKFIYRYVSSTEAGRDSVWLDGDYIYYKLYKGSETVDKDHIKDMAGTINEWRRVILANETAKVSRLQGLTKDAKAKTTLSVAGTTVSHSESASSYYQSNTEYDLGTAKVSGSGGIAPGNPDSENDKQDKTDTNEIGIYGWTVKFSLSGGRSTTTDDDRNYYQTSSMGMGYELATNNNGYFDVDIYSVTPDTVTVAFSDKFDEDDGYAEQTEEAKVHNFIFIPRGGAMRAPWFAVDTTVVYTDTHGDHVALGTQMLRIDNPKIHIDSAVVSNVPGDEKAILTMHLCNETEISDHSKYLTPTALTLYLDDASNPQGAKISIDGVPLSDGRQFFLEPGQSVTKTMEVVRGRGYDYENLRIVLSDLTYTLDHAATFTVHYMPASTPVKLSRPVSGWVINTLSDKDEDGYYLPVEIGGFDINYEGFDHIEMQYKKSTDGDDQWVNLCSFYVNDSLYQAASGEKQLITSSVIRNFKFHGEKDPVEMKYDLRAVSFCRLGTGYVTRSSEVISGMKDTRLPKVFGVPKPSSGILTYEDVISLPFNEEIAYNYLDETANFQVQGYTNNSDIDESSYLRVGKLGGGETKVDRNIAMHDFTIDMMVRFPQTGSIGYLLSVGTTTDNMILGIDDSEHYIYAWMNGREYRSPRYEGIDLTKTLTHVGMIYHVADSTVSFILGEKVYETATVKDYFDIVDMADSLKGACHANGPVRIISAVKEMHLKDIRLWNKALTLHEITNTKGKRLTGTEPGLLCYWPLDETQGNIAVDKAGGADLYLTGTTWETPSGHSLRLENKSVTLQHTDKFQRASTDDYTLSFWFKADPTSSDQAETGLISLLQTGQQGWKIGFEDGWLKATSGTREFGNSGSLDSGISLSDHSWHHLAISVSHTHNTAAFMFDGALVQQTQADSIGGFASDIVRLGSEGFKGNIDNLTFWHVALPVNYIKSTYNASPSGHEMELQVYMPFSTTQKNDQGTIMEVFSPYNMVINSSGTFSKDTMLVATEGMDDASAQAPVKANTGLSNLPFTWTCTDTELQINIDKNDSEINHQQINITVRGVEDLRGNSMAQPQMWTVYVDRNVLTWDEQTIRLDLKYGEAASRQTSWQNQSGRNVAYTIDNNCGWLTLDTDRGEAKPTRSETVTLKVSDGLAPGTYSTVLYLIDENGLSSPLEVNVTVTADEPDWDVTTDPEYNRMMNLVGQVRVTEDRQSAYSLDERDIVAAFYDNVCVGRSYVKVKDNTSYVYMNIVGKADMDGCLLDFYHWNASTNQTSLLDVVQGGNTESQEDGILFVAGDVVGTIENPVQFVTSQSRIQSFQLQQGWNWISLNVAPRGSSVQNLFVTNSPFTKGDKFTTMNGGFVTFVTDGRGGAKWAANDDEVQLGKDSVYQIYMQQAGTLQVRGTLYSDGDRYITLQRKGWNNLPYLLDVDQPINVAMSDYLPMEGGKAMPETVIKSHDAFAMAGTDGRWYGTLEYMHPGEGYYVRHTGDVPCRIAYTNERVQVVQGFKGSEGSRVQEVQSLTSNLSPLTSNLTPPSLVGRAGERRTPTSSYPSSMPIVAMFADEMESDETDALAAIVEGEVRSLAWMSEAEGGRRLFFLTVNADEGKTLWLARIHDGEIAGICPTPLTYSSTTVTGTMERPYVVKMDGVSSATDGDVYNLQGMKLNSLSSHHGANGVFIVNGKKIMKK